MLETFRFDREVYSSAKIRERVDYYENKSNRISELSKSNIKLVISDLEALKDEIETEHRYFDKLLSQAIVTNFEDNNTLVINTYIRFISDIATHLHDTNNNKCLSDNIDEFHHALTYTDIEDLLDDEKTYDHHQAASVGQNLRAISSSSQEYTFLSRTHAFLIDPSDKSYKEVLKVWKRTDGSLFDNETFREYINKKLMNRFK